MSVFEIVIVSIVLVLTLCAFIITIILWIDAEGFTKPEYKIFYDNREVYDIISRVEKLGVEKLGDSEGIIWQKKK